MNTTLLAVVLACGWVAISGGYSLENLVLGGGIAAIIIALFRHRLARPLPLRRVLAALVLTGLFFRELLASAISVAWLVLQPGLERRLKPAIVAFPLKLTTDAEITLLANLITLTPGTLTIDVAADRSCLYIHVLALGSRAALVESIATGFERRIAEVFK